MLHGNDKSDKNARNNVGNNVYHCRECLGASEAALSVNEKSRRLEASSALDEINDQDDDGNYE